MLLIDFMFLNSAHAVGSLTEQSKFDPIQTNAAPSHYFAGIIILT